MPPTAPGSQDVLGRSAVRGGEAHSDESVLAADRLRLPPPRARTIVRSAPSACGEREMGLGRLAPRHQEEQARHDDGVGLVTVADMKIELIELLLVGQAQLENALAACCGSGRLGWSGGCAPVERQSMRASTVTSSRPAPRCSSPSRRPRADRRRCDRRRRGRVRRDGRTLGAAGSSSRSPCRANDAATHPPGRANRTISARTSSGCGTLISSVRTCTRSNESADRLVRRASARRDLGVCEAPIGHKLVRHGDVRRVRVHADDTPAGKHPLAEEVDDATWATNPNR